MSDPDNMEELAHLEHEQWIHWTGYMLDKIISEAREYNVGDIGEIPSIKHWMRQLETKYEDLTEREKESDRTEVRLKYEAYTGVALDE